MGGRKKDLVDGVFIPFNFFLFTLGNTWLLDYVNGWLIFSFHSATVIE